MMHAKIDNLIQYPNGFTMDGWCYQSISNNYSFLPKFTIEAIAIKY